MRVRHNSRMKNFNTQRCSCATLGVFHHTEEGTPRMHLAFPHLLGTCPFLQGAANSACWWQSPQAALSVTPWLGLTAHLQHSLSRPEACTQSTTLVFYKCPSPGKAHISYSAPRPTCIPGCSPPPGSLRLCF